MSIDLHDIINQIRTGRLERVMPCPNCGVNDSQDCGYGSRDYFGEFDCEDPDSDGEPCENCHHLWCEECKENLFQKEEFDVS